MLAVAVNRGDAARELMLRPDSELRLKPASDALGVAARPSPSHRLHQRAGADARREGAPHGTLVTADEQTAGRGRQGRTWTAPPGRALLMSLVLRTDRPALVPLAAGVATAEALVSPRASSGPTTCSSTTARSRASSSRAGRRRAGPCWESASTWPCDPTTSAGAARHAATLGLEPADLQPTLARLLSALERWLTADQDEVIGAWRERDALEGREISWADGSGRAVGIDEGGRLLVGTASGTVALDAGEVHLGAR